MPSNTLPSNTMPTNPPQPATAKKRKFSVQELTQVHAALRANPATNHKDLIDRVMDVLNDPGVTVPPVR